MQSNEVGLLLTMIDSAFDKRSWHGPNLRSSIRGLTEREIVFRPSPGRHSIWEQVVHATYWKYTVWRRITGAKRGSFALKGSNWFPRPDLMGTSSWQQDVALLEETHKQLRGAIAALSPTDLNIVPSGSTVDNTAIIMGIAAHDVYHAGQIQLLKKLSREE